MEQLLQCYLIVVTSVMGQTTISNLSVISKLLKAACLQTDIGYVKLMFICQECQCFRILYAVVTVLDLFLSDQVPQINFNIRHICTTWLRCESFHIYMLKKVCACVPLLL